MIISKPQLPLRQVTPNQLHKNSDRPVLESIARANFKNLFLGYGAGHYEKLAWAGALVWFYVFQPPPPPDHFTKHGSVGLGIGPEAGFGAGGSVTVNSRGDTRGFGYTTADCSGFMHAGFSYYLGGGHNNPVGVVSGAKLRCSVGISWTW